MYNYRSSNTVYYFQGRPIGNGVARGGSVSVASITCNGLYPFVPAALRLACAAASLAALRAAFVGRVEIPFALILIFSQKKAQRWVGLCVLALVLSLGGFA